MRIWFKDAREAQCISRKELAVKACVDPAYISKIEKSQRNPSISLAIKLGKILGFEWQKFYEQLEKEI